MDGPLPAGLVAELERVFREDTDPPGRDLYPAVFDSALLFPLQRRAETAAMIALARTISPRIVMEVGADKAGGVLHWLRAFPLERFVGIEIRGTPYGAVLDAAFPLTECLWIAESSYEPRVVRRVEEWLRGARIDVLFLDGDKARFYDDFEAYLPMVRRRGLVLMHDVRDPAPGEAYQRARKHPRVRETTTIEDISEVAPALEREAAGIAPATPHEGWLRQWRGASCGVGVLWV